MKSNNILDFPKDQSVRIRLFERGRQQRAALALSILSVLMFSVLTNQWLTRTKNLSAEGNGRGIASLSPKMTKADIQWEQDLARSLASAEGVPAELGTRPSLKDDLIYGSLEGRYGVRMEGERISSIQLSGSEEAPLAIDDRAGFFKRYHSLFALDFRHAEITDKKSNSEVWNLIDDHQTIVGQATVEFDNAGRMTSLSVHR